MTLASLHNGLSKLSHSISHVGHTAAITPTGETLAEEAAELHPTPTDKVDINSKGFPKPPEAEVQMQRKGLRSLPSILFNSTLMLTLGLMKVSTLVLAIPGFYVSVAAFAHGFRSLGNDWAKPHIDSVPDKATAIDRLKKRNYVYPKAEYNLKILERFKSVDPSASKTSIAKAIAFKEHLNQKVLDVIDQYIDPKKPTHLTISRKKLEKELGASCKMDGGLNVINRFLYPLDWVVDKAFGGGKASLDHLAKGVYNLEERTLEKDKQLEMGMKVLKTNLAVKHNRRLYTNLRWDKLKEFFPE